jgi:hypothetical protein
MSSSTAIATPSEAKVEGLLDSFDEAPNLFNANPEVDAQETAWNSAWWPMDGGLLADVKRSDLQMKFSQMADELEEGAAVMSATRRAMKLPAFNEILALGDDVIPEVIERLKVSDNRPLWLRVLGTLTPFPPGAGEETIDAAADAWIQWWRGSN